MNIFLTLIIFCIISLFIPHNDKKYNFSWHFRLISSITFFYFLGWFMYIIIKY